MSHEVLPSDHPGTEPAVAYRRPAKPRKYGLVGRSFAEAAGAFLLILAGLGVTLTDTQTGVEPTLAFGLALIAAIVAFGYVSGGHFNPAVTLGLAAAGRTPWSSVLPYIAAQLIGSLGAAGLLWLLLSANAQISDVRALFSLSANGFDENSPIQFPLTSAFLAEVAGTAMFVAVVLGATARAANRSLAPFAIGLAYAALLTMLLPITSGSLNPARSTASALFSQEAALEQLWLFWAAPVLGAVIAGLIYRSVDLMSRERSDASTAGPVDPSKSTNDDGAEQDSASPETVRRVSGPSDDAPAGDAPRDRRTDSSGTDSSSDAQAFFDGNAGRAPEK